MTLPSRRSLILGAGAAIITRRALAYPVRLNNPLAFPGFAPRYNAQHLAAGNGIRYAGVASTGSFINLLTGKQATVVGTITPVISGTIGPATQCITAGSYTHQTAVNETPPALTFATICTYASSLAFDGVLFNNNGNNFNSAAGILIIAPGGSGGFGIGVNGATVSLGSFSPTLGHSYFCAASYNGVTLNLIAVDLTTNKMLQNGSTAATQTLHLTTAASWNIGGDNNGSGDQSGCNIAAIMYSVNFFTLSQLLQWAAAPWDFWYPPTAQNLLFSAVKGKAAATGNGDMGILMP